MIYRALREMEGLEWIVSYEGEQSRGPQRRVYRLTEEGERHLSIWIEDLRRAKREIELLLEAYEEHVEVDHGANE
jgi:DNA-binding PadR family transcriptional regulator